MIFYITLLFCTSTRAMPVDGHSANNPQTDISDDLSMRVSPLDESGNEGLTSNDFFDRIMNYGPSLEGLEFTSDNEEELRRDGKRAGNDVGQTVERTINDVEEIPDLPLEDGILFIYNPKIIMIIQKILISFTRTCHG